MKTTSGTSYVTQNDVGDAPGSPYRRPVGHKGLREHFFTSRASTSSPRRGEHFLRAFQTLISHVDVLNTVARNRDGVIAIISLRRRGDEIRVTAARSQRVLSITFLSVAGQALSPRLPDTDIAR